MTSSESEPTMRQETPRYGQTVALVGAGAAGVLVAIQLVRQADAARATMDVRLIDPALTTGRGVAYSTTDLSHVLNVPAARMSALPDRPGPLRRVAGGASTGSPTPDVSPRVRGTATTSSRPSPPSPTVRPRRSPVSRKRSWTSTAGPRREFTVRLGGGGRFRATQVVLATGSPGRGPDLGPERPPRQPRVRLRPVERARARRGHPGSPGRAGRRHRTDDGRRRPGAEPAGVPSHGRLPERPAPAGPQRRPDRRPARARPAARSAHPR